MLVLAASVVKHHLTSASIVVKMLQYSTTEVTSTWLLPEMVLRVANMLNYFLQFLTGGHLIACCYSNNRNNNDNAQVCQPMLDTY